MIPILYLIITMAVLICLCGLIIYFAYKYDHAMSIEHDILAETLKVASEHIDYLNDINMVLQDELVKYKSMCDLNEGEIEVND